MSLIRARRRRKKNWVDARQGMPRGKLIGFLVMVLVAMWYLGWAF